MKSYFCIIHIDFCYMHNAVWEGTEVQIDFRPKTQHSFIDINHFFTIEIVHLITFFFLNSSIMIDPSQLIGAIAPHDYLISSSFN